VKVVPKISPAFYTMDVKTIIGAVLAGYLPQLYTEFSAIGEKHETLKKAGSIICFVGKPFKEITGPSYNSSNSYFSR